ncbi:MAG: molybdopterin-dependent oxidoreductase, partial [Candidatus Aureabacteria bacterium]|nr:molybdopterin-dependent oxidoreductase [Candidatus Auribacterota bacterium]
ISVLDGSGIPPTGRGRIGVDEGSLMTSAAGVFAAGDCVTGPDIAVSAVASGRRAAYAIDTFLRTGTPAIPPPIFSPARRKKEEVVAAEFADREKTPRVEPAGIPPSRRIGGFAEVEATLDEDAALKEAYRCLECGCEKADDCALRDLAERYRAGDRFGSPAARGKIDDRHPHIVRDPDKCIKCARCIRVCMEVQGIGAWGYAGRGMDMRVAPPFSWPLQQTDCESCGQCLTACPTAALLEKIDIPGMHFVAAAATETTCGNCGDGCEVTLHTYGGQIIRVTPRSNGNLCEKGKFGVGALTTPERIVRPLARTARGHLPLSWDEAAQMVHGRLKGVSPREMAVFVSARLTGEEAYAAQKIVRTVLATNNIHPMAGRPLPAPGQPIASQPATVIENSDAVVVVDPRIVDSNRVAALSVIKAARTGARLLVIGKGETKLNRCASATITLSPDATGYYLKKIAAFVRGAGRPAMILNRSTLTPHAFRALTRFAARHAIRLVALTGEINETGLLHAGVSPLSLPGPVRLADRAARRRLEQEWGCGIPSWRGMDRETLIGAMGRGKIKAAIFMGGTLLEDDLFAKALQGVRFVMVQAFQPSALTRRADIILPAASWAESDGTVTRYDGLELKFRKAVPPLCGYSNTEIWKKIFGDGRPSLPTTPTLRQ